ncbi:MAG: glycosyltransferase, partial [Pseudorhodobacter sp.]|nr:glycosyltransferase [Frankiaceae bacterium]
MTPTPTVSVVVPTHGRGEALAVLVPQLLADQDLDELVVVVDGHGDPSEAFLRAAAEQDARLRPVVQENRGRTLARQRGADEATGDVVVFLDDDVLPRVPLAAAHARHHLDRDDLVVVGAMTTSPARWDPRARLYDKAYSDHVALWQEHPERLLEHFWGGHFSMRRATLQRLDGFSPEASYG